MRLVEKRIYRDCQTGALFDSDDRILSSRPTENISASPDSHQARSQSVAWFHGTWPRNKIRQEIVFRGCCTYVVSAIARSSFGTHIAYQRLRSLLSSTERFLLSIDSVASSIQSIMCIIRRPWLMSSDRQPALTRVSRNGHL